MKLGMKQHAIYHHGTFSEGPMDFSARTRDASHKKVVVIALPCGLFPRFQWKVIPFRDNDGNLIGVPTSKDATSAVTSTPMVGVRTPFGTMHRANTSLS